MAAFRPMLAAAVLNPAKLRFPLLASYKLDGFRALVRDGVLVSRSLKPIPNRHLQGVLGRPSLEGLDGELVVGPPTAPDAFRRTSSDVMRLEGRSLATFHVFDCVNRPAEPYTARLDSARLISLNPWCELVVQQSLLDESELRLFEDRALELGYEGVMLRDGSAPYKHGRGTLLAQDLMKLKRFEDAEAMVVGVQEQLHNGNEAMTNALGHTERGTKRAGMTGKGVLGALLVRGLNGVYKDVEFGIGTGFDDATRKNLWAHSRALVGLIVKYKYFATGSKDAPRFPVFLGFRDPKDL